MPPAGLLVFPHCNPNDILDDRSAAYAAIKVSGLSHPRYQYVAGEPRKISFQLLLFKGPFKESVNWRPSLLYPEHAGTPRALRTVWCSCSEVSILERCASFGK